MNIRVVTGITTSGTPHLGNYAGAIKPAIIASVKPNVESFFFLADYHALIKCHDPNKLYRSRLEIAATWLAVGLDIDRVVFYRQSDIPEIVELSWILTCSTAKGLMNRAHAYKACVSNNLSKGLDQDDTVSMGLFSYPILMAADILMFKANKVPVGKDQVQHLEMARDIAQKFNRKYNNDFFVLPEALVASSVGTLPGLDGRKMSKSYNNTIPLFEGSAKDLKSSIMHIITDSKEPGEYKDAYNSHLYILYKAFSNETESEEFRKKLALGMSWSEAKKSLYEKIEYEIFPMREKYSKLITQPDLIEKILQFGAQKARVLSKKCIEEVRDLIGIRSLIDYKKNNLGKGINYDSKINNSKNKKKARLICYRDDLNKFRIRLLSTTGKELLTIKDSFSNADDAVLLMKKLNWFLKKSEMNK
ncbi:tryptophanyl-tRNA synthetase [Candidatus Kinetoplastibacterium desouzaii TCC079E]|uniref:Tryptophan--tRNA ligase n=1 Tax=Candidatus Kinetoplastidibacterium desouzai TCC079E TaxID=1208919 RepID=M1LS66_9PROT|nr:tryptophan--tRNA ligase [Candidatus Kinetoplastibacterium desouzaii]AGF46986.1 tryptophanyl-tRNA synthetase [Candidatus Kinetoplastibacterium desouzaii TCC079E]